MTIKTIADSKGPHKILTLDGGGIRGAMTIEILAKIETIVKKKGCETLSDYFDYMAGTSTGAILATGLSLGWSVDKLRTFYEQQGEKMFDGTYLWNKFHYSYDADYLRETLQAEVGDITLGTEKLKTLLMVVLRNATTDSSWPVSNNPYAKYNDTSRPDCNLHLPLWQLVRASTAAPTFFPPECVKVGDHNFVFVDGGVTCYNNPSFHTFLMATTEPYQLNWATGEKELLVVSVGTGLTPLTNANLKPGKMNLMYNAKSIPGALMFAASNEQDFLCRTFGNCLSGQMIDREIGDMCSANDSACKGPAKEKLFTYLRYNAELTESGLSDLGLTNIDAEKMQEMDVAENVGDLQKIGKAVAEKYIDATHFSDFN